MPGRPAMCPAPIQRRTTESVYFGKLALLVSDALVVRCSSPGSTAPTLSSPKNGMTYSALNSASGRTVSATERSETVEGDVATLVLPALARRLMRAQRHVQVRHVRVGTQTYMVMCRDHR